MPESLPALAIGASAVAAYLSKEFLGKFLGPTADYMGEGLRNFVEKRTQTTGQIFENASLKLGSRVDVPGEVPLKVLKVILDEGSFSNDALAVEYFGGILASSRTEEGRDDRGARIAKLVDSLSTYQLRTHYLIYSTICKLFASSGLLLGNEDNRRKMEIFIPVSGYARAMDFSSTEADQFDSLLSHIVFGLHGDNLIEGVFQYGALEHIVKYFPAATESGIICQPSPLGVELFLSAFGHADKPLDYFFDPDFSPIVEGLPTVIEGACATKAITP